MIFDNEPLGIFKILCNRTPMNPEHAAPMLPKSPDANSPSVSKNLSPDARRVLRALIIVLAALPPVVLIGVCARLRAEGFEPGPLIPPLDVRRN
jgi:hypothetical protein